MNKMLILFSVILMISSNIKAQINIHVVDSLIDNAVNLNSFEGTVLIAENGNIAYQRSVGFKDLPERSPINNSTRFSIASITKLFTAIITLQLVEEGKFDLSDNLNQLVPELEVPGSSNITVHHLLLHISGLPNENDIIYTQLKTPRQFVAETVLNESNTLGTFNYANIDYVLLGLIIEKFDTVPFEQSIQNRILEKYSLNETGFLMKGNYPGDFAYSFSFNEDDIRTIDLLFNIENYYAAGSMYSTAQDLLKLDQLLYDDNFLSEESKEQMFTSYPAYNYSGYGVWTYNYPFARSSPKIMERRGGIRGANSVLIRFLDTNKTIIILSKNNKFNPDSFGNIESLKESLMIEIDKSGS